MLVERACSRPSRLYDCRRRPPVARLRIACALKTDGDDVVAVATPTVSFVESLLQAGFTVAAASALASWQGISWNFDLPIDAEQAVLACSLIPTAFLMTVCLPDYKVKGPVVSMTSDIHVCSSHCPLCVRMACRNPARSSLATHTLDQVHWALRRGALPKALNCLVWFASRRHCDRGRERSGCAKHCPGALSEKGAAHLGLVRIRLGIDSGMFLRLPFQHLFCYVIFFAHATRCDYHRPSG